MFTQPFGAEAHKTLPVDEHAQRIHGDHQGVNAEVKLTTGAV